MIIKLTRNQLNSLEIVVVIFWLSTITNIQIPSFVDSIIKLMSYVLVALLVMNRFQRVAYFATRDIFLLLLTVLAAFSYFWSVLPGDTMTAIKALLRNSVFAAYFAMRFNLKEQMKVITIVLSIGVILSLLAGLLIPSYGIAPYEHGTAWRGIYEHKNFLARMMGLSAQTFLLLAIYKKKFLKISCLGLILSLMLLLLSQGKSSLLIFLISLLILPLYITINKSYKLQTLIYIFSLIFGSIFLTLIISNWETIIVDILGKNLTLNGRTFIWQRIISQVISAKFWGGYGYAAFWGSDDSFQAVRGTWAGVALQEEGGFHAHSGYIDLFSQLGMIGLLLFLLSFVYTVHNVIKLLRLTKNIEAFWSLQFLAFIFLLNINITQTIMMPHLFWVIYMSISLSTIVENERYKKRILMTKKQTSKYLIQPSRNIL